MFWIIFYLLWAAANTVASCFFMYHGSIGDSIFFGVFALISVRNAEGYKKLRAHRKSNP